MEESVFPVELTMPADDSEDWEASSVGHTGYGPTAAGALANLGEQLDDLVEDAEYNRIHAPGIHGHPPGGMVPEGQPVHDLPLQEGERSAAPATVHPTEPTKDSV